MKLVQEDSVDRPRLPVGKNYGFANKVNLRLLEAAQDGESYFLSGQRGFFSNGLTPS